RPGTHPTAAARSPSASQPRLDFTAICYLPVAKVDDARAKRHCLDELQVDPLVQGRKVRRAPAQDDRADEEPVLVDETELHEGRGQASAADSQVLARLFLQTGDLLDSAVRDKSGIVLDLLECLREHDLRCVLPDAGELEYMLR